MRPQTATIWTARLAPATQGFLLAGLVGLFAPGGNASAVEPNPKDDGYRGIWFTLGQRTPYGDKYSGGLGTYTANHVPMAIYAKEANKTFFVYGGAKQGKRYLLNMIAYYDHARGVVPRPTIVHDKKGVDDPHDNPSLCLDPQGHLWVFVSGRARARPGFIYRSTKPYSIEQFEMISQRAQRRALGFRVVLPLRRLAGLHDFQLRLD